MQFISDVDLAAQQCARTSNLEQLRAQHAALAEQIAAETVLLQDVGHEMRRRELAAALAAAKDIDWADSLREGQGMPHHRARNEALKALGLSSNGFFPETLQRCVCIQMHPDGDGQVDELAASLAVVMPHVLALPDGWCAMNIVETRQLGANYQLRFLPDFSRFQVANMRLRSPYIEITSGDLRVVLAHIQRHHYFIEPSPDGACS